MEAEDTVIKGGVTQELHIKWSNTITGHILGWAPTLEADAQEKFDEFVRQIRLEQAEISFKAGQDKGFEIGLEQGKAEGRRELNKAFRL